MTGREERDYIEQRWDEEERLYDKLESKDKEEDNTMHDPVSSDKLIRFEIRRARNGQSYWRIVHRNGNQLERSSETYKRKSICKRVMENMIWAIYSGDYEIKDVTTKKKSTARKTKGK